jgi:asparagine synthase (glutamine-hydrolysing)
MCGINGKIRFNADPVAPEDIARMNLATRHRGPDDQSVFVSADATVGLGLARLAVIDLSPLGRQPMSYMDRYWIVFNGEIYNFQQCRADLERDGYRFRSKTDTEVILALYDKHREKCLDHLRGMFALAIYDKKDQTIFCARDRLGKKPFKYYLDDDVFIFSSELKAILTQDDYERKPDYTALHHYLTYFYCPAPFTGFEGIRKLEPGHYLRIHIPTRKIHKERYWRLDYSRQLQLTEDEWCERIRDKLEESVRLRMVSDVPVGAFLSGGVDSSAVVAFMSRASGKRIKTFSIGFDNAAFSEVEYARIVARKYDTDHTEFEVNAQSIDELPLIVRHFEEPYADDSALPTYYLSKLAREHVTVALNGDGGDECFAGYRRYNLLRMSRWYDKLMLPHKYIGLPAAALLASITRKAFFHKMYRYGRKLTASPMDRYINFINCFDNETKPRLYDPAFREFVDTTDSYDLVRSRFEDAGVGELMDQMLYADFGTYLPDDLMVKVDINSMAVSLEGRSPILDHEFVELAARIPFRMKLRGVNTSKYIFKKALRGLVPDRILDRPKMGFGTPLAPWLRTGLAPFARDTLLSSTSLSRGLFDGRFVRSMIESHVAGRRDHSRLIWALLTLEMWFKEYFDQSHSERPGDTFRWVSEKPAARTTAR